MEKKTTKIERIETITTYVAYDGTEFKSESECEKYEETAGAVIEKAFYNLMVGGKPFFECEIYENFGYGSEELYYGVIDIKNSTDLEIANRYYTFNQASKLLDTSCIGKRLLVCIGFCFDNIKRTNPNPITMEELVEEFTRDINKFFNKEEE